MLLQTVLTLMSDITQDSISQCQRLSWSNITPDSIYQCQRPSWSNVTPDSIYQCQTVYLNARGPHGVMLLQALSMQEALME